MKSLNQVAAPAGHQEAKEREIKNELAAIVAVQNREKMRQEEYRSAYSSSARCSARRCWGRLYNEAMMFERYVEFAQVIKSQQEKIDAMEPRFRRCANGWLRRRATGVWSRSFVKENGTNTCTNATGKS